MPRRTRGSRAAGLEEAGQLQLEFEVPWIRRLAAARQLALDLRPGITLESQYRHWWPVMPNAIVLGPRNPLGVVVPIPWLSTAPASILARLRRGRAGCVELGARMTPNVLVSVSIRVPRLPDLPASA